MRGDDDRARRLQLTSLDVSSHVGTHCDAPYHFLEQGARIDELRPSSASSAGRRGRRHRAGPAHADHLGAPCTRRRRVRPGVIVLLRTGWDVHRESDAYFTHPYLDGDACARLLALGVRTIGIDAINIDETPAGDLDLERFRCHAQISAAGGVIVENLSGLGAIDFPEPVISVLPLRLAGGDGRARARGRDRGTRLSRGGAAAPGSAPACGPRGASAGCRSPRSRRAAA